MATRTKSRKNEDPNLSELSIFDRAAKNIFSVLDDSYQNKQILNSKDRKFREIINRELDVSKGVSQGSIVDFVSSMNLGKKDRNVNTNRNMLSPDTNELFTKNINDIFSYFQDMYRNKFIEINDLKFIAKFIPALGEAVKTVLDSIVSSDNMSETINRTIILPPGTAKEDETAIINEIQRIEDEKKLLPKLKTIVYKKALVTGTHYVYAVPYAKIFEEYDYLRKKENRDMLNLGKGQFGNYVDKDKKDKAHNPHYSSANESYMIGDNIDITPAMENIKELLSTSELIAPEIHNGINKTHYDQKTIKNKMNELYNSLPDITCESTNIYLDAFEDLNVLLESEGAMEAYVKSLKKSSNNGKNLNDKHEINPLELRVPDGTVGSNGNKDGKIRVSKFNIPGLYIKYIDSKHIIPLKVFDQTIGYYLIHPKARKNRNSIGEVTGINSIGNTLFSAVNIGEAKKHDAVQRIVDTIADGVLNNFSKKFVTKNAKYKKMIADVIIANGLTDKDYNIQFIPESDIIPFTIQENEEGFGESILSDSLFPAKLLLSMIVTRMLNYINKTGNKTIAHIHRGPVNAFDNNQLNRVIRDLQEQDITFNDLLSPNLVFNKFNRDGNMVIPTARNDTKLVEFEIQEGQQIDMSPEYEKELEKMVILGTPVPHVLLDYESSADFAKQIVSASITYAGRIASLQSDLESPTTLLYKKMVEVSNLTDDQKALCSQSLEIKLPRPKVLVNNNNNEFITNIIQLSEALADTCLGRDTLVDQEKNPDGVRNKELLMREIVKTNTPFIDWDDIDKMIDKVKILTKEEQIEKENQKPNNENSDMGGGY